MGDDSGPTGSSIVAQLIAVGIFIAITVGLLFAYSRVFEPGAGEGAAMANSPQRRPSPPRVPSDRVRDFYTRLRSTLGTNARGLPAVSAVNYDAATDRLHVVLSLDHTLQAPAEARAAGTRRMLDVLRAYHAAGLGCTSVLITATAPAPGPSTNSAEVTVMRSQFSRDRLARADWPRLKGDDVPALAEQFWLYPELEPPAPGAARPDADGR